MKLTAHISSKDAQQATEHSFDIYLIDRCKQELRGQKHVEAYEEIYSYTDEAIVVRFPFIYPDICNFPFTFEC